MCKEDTHDLLGGEYDFAAFCRGIDLKIVWVCLTILGIVFMTETSNWFLGVFAASFTTGVAFCLTYALPVRKELGLRVVLFRILLSFLASYVLFGVGILWVALIQMVAGFEIGDWWVPWR